MPDQLKYLKRLSVVCTVYTIHINFGDGCVALSHTQPTVSYKLLNDVLYQPSIDESYGNRRKSSFWVTVSHTIFSFLQV